MFTVSYSYFSSGYNYICQHRKQGLSMKLAEYMVSKGLRQSDLAKTLGVSQVTIHNWIYHKRPPSGQHMMDIFKMSGGRINLRDWAEAFDEKGR